MDKTRNPLLAKYPLAVYFFLLTGFLLLVWGLLSLNTGASNSMDQIISFITGNILGASFFAILLLVLVFIISSLAYKEIVNMSAEDYALWREQKATRTSFPLFSGVHDKLRLRSSAYRKWHTNTHSDSLNYLLVIVFSAIFLLNISAAGGKVFLAGPPELEPPADPPIMNAPSDITTSSIRWNITDNTTTEDNHTFQRSDHFIVGTVVSTTKATTGTTYSFNETGLSPNTSYTRHAHATNGMGESAASSNATATTLANVPGAPTVTVITFSSINVKLNANGNPASTEFAIQETTTGQFVQAGGALSDTTAWNTYASWGGDNGKNVTGLSVDTNYSFRVKARNGDEVETAYSASASDITFAKTPTSPALTVVSTTSIKIIINENGNPSSVEYAIFNETSNKFVTSSGSLSSSPDWNTKSNFGGAAGVTNTGIAEETDYTYKVKARNSNNIETGYSPGNTVNTGSPGSSSGGGEGGGSEGGSGGGSGGSGGGSSNGGNDQLTVEIDILGVDPDTGSYSIRVDKTVESKKLKGEITGMLVDDEVSGTFIGTFDGINVTGPISGKVNNNELSSVTLALTGEDNPNYKETLLVKGVVGYKSLLNTIVPPIGSSGGVGADIAVASLALLTAVAAIPSILSSIITQAISSINGWMFLGYVPRRRKRVWGQVINSDTHVPVAGVRVKLINSDSKRVGRVMTDRTGRYGFLVDKPGNYMIVIHSPLYLDYSSEVINITDTKAEVIGKDIFLKPDEAEVGKRVAKTAKLLRFMKIISYLHWPLLVGGSVLSGYLVITEPTTSRVLVAALYLALWSIEVYQLSKHHSYGTVVNSETDEGEPMTVVQLTKDKGGVNAVASSAITDKHGKFFFVVKKGSYNLSATKAGFVPTSLKFNGETPNAIVKISKTNE